jgi:hypothetical protein
MKVCTRLVSSIFVLMFSVFSAGPVFASDTKTEGIINCDIRNQPCVRQVSGGRIIFDIRPKPVKAMEDLTFEVKTEGLNLSGPPVIDLGMPGMKMGPNQVKLKMTDADLYQGTGIIVRCPSGRTIWQATVHLPGIGDADFVFDVVYD